MNLLLSSIADEVLTDAATKNANPTKLVQSMVNCLRENTNTGSVTSRKSMAMTIGSDASAELPDDFNGIVRIGMCKNGCFYPISYNSDICSQPCSCENESTENTCTNCGGYGWGTGIYFGDFGWWGNGIWNGANPKFFAGISAKSFIGEYKVILNGLSSKWLQFSTNLAGETIAFEYESTLEAGTMSVPVLYKPMLMNYARWQYFQGDGKYNEAQYFEKQYWNSFHLFQKAKIKESYTLDDLQRMKYDLFSSVKI